MQLASRFASRSPMLRANHPLSDGEIQRVAPSIFAEAPHESRSERYSYIPTAAVLTELRREGFQPFMVCQTRVRDEGKREHTKHMIRLRHASQIAGSRSQRNHLAELARRNQQLSDVGRHVPVRVQQWPCLRRYRRGRARASQGRRGGPRHRRRL